MNTRSRGMGASALCLTMAAIAQYGCPPEGATYYGPDAQVRADCWALKIYAPDDTAQEYTAVKLNADGSILRYLQ